MLSNDLIKFKSDDFEKAENAGAIKSTNNGPEDGVTSIFNRDGSISYFTDFTNPSNKSDSAMGYSMINA